MLQKALEVIDAEGYAAASVTRIAEAAGISKTGLLHHFGSKENLFTEVLRMRDELDDSHFQGPGLTLTESEDAYLDLVARNSKIPGLVELFTRLSVEATDPDHPAREFFLRRNAELGQRIADRAAESMKDRQLDAIDPDMVALLLLAATDGLQSRWLLNPEIDMKEALATLFRIFHLALENPQHLNQAD